MKKSFTFLFLVTLLFAMSLPTNSNAEDLQRKNTSSLYIESDSVATEYTNYVKEEKNNIFSSLKDVVDERILNSLYSEDIVYFGNGFTLNEIHYFPVLCHNKIIAMLAVLQEEGEYSWTLSTDFVEGLNEIASKTSVDKPARIYIEKANVYADISGDVYQLTFIPEFQTIGQEKTTQNVSDSSQGVMDIYDVTERITTDVFEIKSESRTSSSKYLFLDLKENQEHNSWCAAYAGAQILRYTRRGNIYARDILKHYYPYLNDSDLKNKSISNDQLIKYANLKKSFPYRRNSTLSQDGVKSQINNNKPIYLGCAGTGIYDKQRHAFVLRGYNTSNNTYSVWNPWRKGYISMSASSKSIAVNGGRFIWDNTIQGW